MTAYRALHSATSTLVVTDDDAVPRVVHWGERLADEACDAAALDALTDLAVPHGGLDVVVPLSLLPEAARGWNGHGGIRGHRADSTGWSPLLRRTASGGGERSWQWTGADEDAGLGLSLRLALDADGVLEVDVALTNTGSTPYTLDSLAPVLPLPPRAAEVLTLGGRWTKELQEARVPLLAGAVVRENRRGRTSHESSPTLAVGTTAFAHESGEVWFAHLAWSGDHEVRAEVLPDGRRTLCLAELLRPGEVVLAPGETYAAPTVVATWSASGLNGTSQQMHRHVRGRPTHPTSPRPVLLNTWEAVYFQHDEEQLRRLAEVAAQVGVERFVLDDGWFTGRDDDTRALGDWEVDRRAYPDGLGGLAADVVGLGMQFGLWVEPEMVNPDSDLYRAHPDWVLGAAGHPHVLGRHQLVLDLTRREVASYLLERLDALVTELPIGYLKWDMNRELVDAAGSDGAPATHRQTLALYALLDEVRRRHPGLEIESCASGGGRVDLGMAARTERFWASDSNDALERQRIQRAFGYLLPPELMGAHVGGAWAHTTARTQVLPFRAATALFGHLGLEWNLLTAGPEDLAGIRGVIEAHKRLRPLLHAGRVVQVDHPDPTALVHGVVGEDGAEALFCHAQLTSADTTVPAPMRMPGLTPDRRYRVERLVLPGAHWDLARHHPSWYDDGLVASGSLLSAVGVPLGVHVPEQATLVHAVAIT